MGEAKDGKQIAFIVCVNNEMEYAECSYYLDRLRIPEGYKKDLIAVREASSMTAGYNAGMKSSDAKYKVYMHQDVFIRNIDFISDLLNVFANDSQIGLVGVVGARNLGKDAVAVTDWDTGNILDNCVSSALKFPAKDSAFQEVQALDGLLLATQYDILWREDLFNGWDFYDISQCMEFQRAGYKIVVPNQKEAWCYHDNTYSKMRKYEDYRKIFCLEYGNMGQFQFNERSSELLAYERAKESAREEVERLMSAGLVMDLRSLFQNPDNRGYLYLKEFEAIVDIDRIEEQNQSQKRFWEKGMSAKQLVAKLRGLKYMLKRIEFGAGCPSEIWKFIKENYSECAADVVCRSYISDRKRMIQQ